jgi:hypothetical protein
VPSHCAAGLCAQMRMRRGSVGGGGVTGRTAAVSGVLEVAVEHAAACASLVTLVVTGVAGTDAAAGMALRGGSGTAARWRTLDPPFGLLAQLVLAAASDAAVLLGWHVFPSSSYLLGECCGCSASHLRLGWHGHNGRFESYQRVSAMHHLAELLLFYIAPHWRGRRGLGKARILLYSMACLAFRRLDLWVDECLVSSAQCPRGQTLYEGGKIQAA